LSNAVISAAIAKRTQALIDGGKSPRDSRLSAAGYKAKKKQKYNGKRGTQVRQNWGGESRRDSVVHLAQEGEEPKQKSKLVKGRDWMKGIKHYKWM